MGCGCKDESLPYSAKRKPAPRDPVVVGIATIAERRDMLPQVLESLRGQCAEIHLYMNHKDTMQAVGLANSFGDKVHVYMRDSGDMGDAGKYYPFFIGLKQASYCLTCDDDLIYPPDYVEQMIAAVERYERKYAVSMHGKEYYGPVSSYYRDINTLCMSGEASAYHCLHKQEQDAPVTVLGTGCAAWHSSMIELSKEDFPLPNMADIWFSRKLNNAGIKRYAIAHEPLEYLEPPKGSTIWDKHHMQDAIQTAVFNSVNWTL